MGKDGYGGEDEERGRGQRVGLRASAPNSELLIPIAFVGMGIGIYLSHRDAKKNIREE